MVFGGVDIGPQMKQLHAGVEILVATPGRLLDLLGRFLAHLDFLPFRNQRYLAPPRHRIGRAGR